MNIIIYSFNRACQLDALLRTLKLSFKEYHSSNISAIWKSDRDDFRLGYEKLQNKFSEVNWVSEANSNNTFKQQTIDCIDETKEFTMFLVDDIMFKSSFSCQEDFQFNLLKQFSSQRVLCISLRLDKNIKHCYATNFIQQVPDMTAEQPLWNWTTAQGDWGYPMSVDGNMFLTKIIKKIVRGISFSHPNEFEANMDRYAKANKHILPNHMLCYHENSKLFNVPANRVQNVAKNRVENSHDVLSLNNKYIKENLVIDTSGLNTITNISCHHPYEYRFVKDPQI